MLTVTELLRKHKVVGKFVEFFGEGTRTLALPDRATIANMAPEYGATMGFFPVDERTIDYFKGTGRSKRRDRGLRGLLQGAGAVRRAGRGEIDYSQVVELDLGDGGAIAGRPQAAAGPHRADRRVHAVHPAVQRAGGRQRLQPAGRRSWRSASPTSDGLALRNGDVLIAAITSCTNTSNPSVLLAAGLLAKKAVEAGLKVQPHIKTSLAPGSRIVTEYLTKPACCPTWRSWASTSPATAAPPASAMPAT